MTFCQSVEISFTDCPDCVDEFDMFSEILHNASDNIDGVLRGVGLPYIRQGNRLIEAKFACGASCTFRWKDGIADVNHWTC